jgi:hypothetical protein
MQQVRKWTSDYLTVHWKNVASNTQGPTISFQFSQLFELSDNMLLVKSSIK